MALTTIKVAFVSLGVLDLRKPLKKKLMIYGRIISLKLKQNTFLNQSKISNMVKTTLIGNLGGDAIVNDVNGKSVFICFGVLTSAY